MRRAVGRVTRKPERAYLAGLTLTGVLQSSSAISVIAVSFAQVGLLRLSEAYFPHVGGQCGHHRDGLVGGPHHQQAIAGWTGTALVWRLPCLSCFSSAAARGLWEKPSSGFRSCSSAWGCSKKVCLPLLRQAWLVFWTSSMLGACRVHPWGGAHWRDRHHRLAEFFRGHGPHYYPRRWRVVTEFTGAAVILGANIGTTSTAILASLVAGREARRVAAVHFLLNAVGVVLFLTACSSPYWIWCVGF